jgi:hypothetical protein
MEKFGISKTNLTGARERTTFIIILTTCAKNLETWPIRLPFVPQVSGSKIDRIIRDNRALSQWFLVFVTEP